ncbi:hypothetical protein BLOT_004253 [Blomia tropicalis]|nr:hypothetical protein BLOT_004253 [Blomia tropicalis]
MYIIETNSLIVNNEMASGISKQTQWQPSTGKYDYIQQLLNDNSSEIMVNWISFKKRFIWQCTILFVVLLIVTILCFYPEEQLFDIVHSSKYAFERDPKNLENSEAGLIVLVESKVVSKAPASKYSNRCLVIVVSNERVNCGTSSTITTLV